MSFVLLQIARTIEVIFSLARPDHFFRFFFVVAENQHKEKRKSSLTTRDYRLFDVAIHSYTELPDS